MNLNDKIIELKEKNFLTIKIIADGIFSPSLCEISASDSEIKELYDLIDKYGKLGHILWCCKKENLQPYFRVVNQLKNDMLWCEDLEKLPVNPLYKNVT